MDVSGYFRFLTDVCGYSKSLVDIVGYFILVEFSRNLSRFFKFWFRVRAVYYRVFLLITKGSK